MDHDHGTDMDMTSSASAAGADADMGDQFCNGAGTVMLMGFQAATTESVNCILFLFEGAAVDSKTKYAFAALGAFAMGFTNEMIRYGRDRLSKTCDVSLTSDIIKTAAFAVQIYLAYMLMLLVMLYEYVILIMIILGLSVGHLITLRATAAQRRAARNNGAKTPPEVMNSSGTPCCNNDTCA